MNDVPEFDLDEWMKIVQRYGKSGRWLSYITLFATLAFCGILIARGFVAKYFGVPEEVVVVGAYAPMVISFIWSGLTSRGRQNDYESFINACSDFEAHYGLEAHFGKLQSKSEENARKQK